MANFRIVLYTGCSKKGNPNFDYISSKENTYDINKKYCEILTDDRPNMIWLKS